MLTLSGYRPKDWATSHAASSRLRRPDDLTSTHTAAMLVDETDAETFNDFLYWRRPPINLDGAVPIDLRGAHG